MQAVELDGTREVRPNWAQILDRFFLLDRGERFAALEGLRAWAILSVFCVHFNAHWFGQKRPGSWFNEVISAITFGHLGVDLFFVLSGFLIYRLIVRTRPSFLSFLLNRYRRLLPAHVAVILASLVGTPLLTALANIAFVNYFFPSLANLNFVTWSLSYELVFYMAAGGLFMPLALYGPTRRWTLAALMCVSAVPFFLLPSTLFDGTSRFRIPEIRFMGFFFGVAAAMIFESDVFRRLERLLPWIGAAGFALCAFLSRYVWGWHIEKVTQQPYQNLFYLAADVGFASLCLSVLSPRRNLLHWIFSNKILRMMGIVSYSFYLCHANLGLPLFERIFEYVPALHTYSLAYLAALATSLLLATFLFHFLEKPYFRARR